ncbi:hypothetical protein CEXT_130921 [Caerostris extrusa]|uniref:Uncharacterized protein n=1 Tax=Caerostris extrusa TaxID=172846 RepID=A0AAV4S2Q9_CAEEX|nr:hypothetical protein CEXT_130921 [Caerostris extrusa]
MKRVSHHFAGAFYLGKNKVKKTKDLLRSTPFSLLSVPVSRTKLIEPIKRAPTREKQTRLERKPSDTRFSSSLIRSIVCDKSLHGLFRKRLFDWRKRTLKIGDWCSYWTVAVGVITEFFLFCNLQGPYL